MMDLDVCFVSPCAVCGVECECVCAQASFDFMLFTLHILLMALAVQLVERFFSASGGAGPDFGLPDEGMRACVHRDVSVCLSPGGSVCVGIWEGIIVKLGALRGIQLTHCPPCRGPGGAGQRASRR